MIRFITFIIVSTLSTFNYVSAQDLARHQEPVAPYNYISEDVYFTNTEANDIKLAGTITLPNNKKNPAIAILISGSGAQDRNSDLKQFNHKPFLVLSDYLTNNGIAVLRFDDRGTAKSEGNHATATSADFATDVEAAIQYLKTRKDIDINKIGLIGHSEGGFIAPMVASTNKDVAFTVLLAGTGVNGAKVLETQTRRAAELQGASKESLDENEKLTTIVYNAILNNDDKDVIKNEIRKGLNDFKTNNSNSPLAAAITPQIIEQQLGILQSDWLLYFLKTDPKQFLAKTTCPVLALNGSKDYQVMPDLNLKGIKEGLEKANNEDVTIKELENLNHLFQTAITGSAQEYSKIEETYAPMALKIISDWINKRF